MRHPTDTTPTAPVTARAAAAPRRGIALMLVVITLATATVLTTSFLVTQQNTPSIGSAAAERVASEWSARGTADVIEAAMETNADWITPANAGLLVENMAFMGADVNVAVTGVDGGPVSPADRQVVMTVRASADGQETVVQRVIEVKPDGDYTDALDPELREFGVYAAQELRVESGSHITPWPASAVAQSGEYGKIGLGFDRVAGFQASTNTLSPRTHSYLPPTAGAGIETTVASSTGGATVLPVKMWETTVDLRPEAVSQANAADLNPNIIKDIDLPAARYTTIKAHSGAVVTLGVDGTTTDYAAMTVEVKDARLRIKGDVHLTVLDGTKVCNDAAILFEDGARLTLYTNGDVTFDDAVVGDPDAADSAKARTPEMLSTWHDPRRFRVLQLSTSLLNPAPPEVTITGGALVIGSVHLPRGGVTVENSSALAGRVTADTLEITRDSAVFIDPVFDNKMGLTESSCVLYDINGDPPPGLAAAMAAVTDDEGFDDAMAAVMAQIPALTPRDNTPDGDGSNKRYDDRARWIVQWPVRVVMQEHGNEVRFFAVPTDPTVVAKLGHATEQAERQFEIDNGDLVDDGSGGKTASVVDDVMLLPK